MKYKFITVEGNIGAGKTSLAKLLGKHLGAKLILETFAENPFLPKFFEMQSDMLFLLNCFFSQIVTNNCMSSLKSLIYLINSLFPIMFL